MNLPRSVYEGDLSICGVTLRCHVLDTGERIFEQEGVKDLLAAWQAGVEPTEDETLALAHFVQGTKP